MMLSMDSVADRSRDLAAATETYVAKTLHAPFELRPWRDASELPPYLRNTYCVMRGAVRGRDALWLLAEEELTPGAVEKHMNALSELWPDAQVVVSDRLPSYARARLIDRGIAFVVPGMQLYLPDHGIDFRSRGKQQLAVSERLRPSAQALLLHSMLRWEADEPSTATKVAPLLGYTLMTMSRAVAELDAHGLIETNQVGRSKEFRFIAGRRETWNRALPLLSSPVKRRITVSESTVIDVECRLAGLSALARHTMLAPPRSRTCAVGANDARAVERSAEALTREGASLLEDEDARIIEVWSYDPAVLSKGPVVDVLSLYLSLRDDPDERVQAALTRMMERLPW